MEKTITMGNDEFILYIRKQHKACNTSTSELGRKIWEWIRDEDNFAKPIMKDMPCLWETKEGAKNIGREKLPETATQFVFDRNLLPQLYCYLDELGRK